jgi:hypothetical protein
MWLQVRTVTVSADKFAPVAFLHVSAFHLEPKIEGGGVGPAAAAEPEPEPEAAACVGEVDQEQEG